MHQVRHAGTDGVSSIPWGTHYCQFYETSQDLVDQVVPYLKAGLERREKCVWVTSEPMTPGSARDALLVAVPNVDRLLAEGQLHIAPYTDWYMKDGYFDQQRVLGGWMTFLEQALTAGYEGLRVTGNTAWLEPAGWTDFEAYEAAISGAIEGRPVLVLCTYDLHRCGASEILDVVKNHDFALVKRGAKWDVIQSQQYRAMQGALHETQERYEALFHHALNGIAVHDMVTDDEGRPVDYTFVDVNAAFERMTGLGAHKVVGRRVTQVLPGIEKSAFIPTYGRVALTGEPVRFQAFAEPLGRHYDISAFSPRRGQFAVVFNDVTDEKQAEAERERLFREARDANRLKDEFLATLSHELRTPLNAILGWSQMLAEGHLDPPTQRRAIEAIARNAQAQHRLVADVLDVSRIITGKLRLALGEIDLLQVIDDALGAIRPAAEGKHIALSCVSSLPTARLVADHDRVQQVLWNLLSNAVKFTPSGGSVRVEVRGVDSRIEVRVTDTGIGIAPEFLPRAFERFTQHDGSTGRQHGGLGLGLAIARHLVELHGGTIRVESEGERHGATFIIQLPVRAIVPVDVDAESQRVTSEPATATAPNLAGVRVLVADDDDDARQLIELTLSAAGARVMLAASGPEVIAAAERHPFDVLICDIGMPKMDGFEVIRAIRALGGTAARASAIAFTAYGRPEDCAQAIAAGYDRHVAKPVLPMQLVSAVFEAVSCSRT